jgi:hypothetical protein
MQASRNISQLLSSYDEHSGRFKPSGLDIASSHNHNSSSSASANSSSTSTSTSSNANISPGDLDKFSPNKPAWAMFPDNSKLHSADFFLQSLQERALELQFDVHQRALASCCRCCIRGVVKGSPVDGPEGLPSEVDNNNHVVYEFVSDASKCVCQRSCYDKINESSAAHDVSQWRPFSRALTVSLSGLRYLHLTNKLYSSYKDLQRSVRQSLRRTCEGALELASVAPALAMQQMHLVASIAVEDVPCSSVSLFNPDVAKIGSLADTNQCEDLTRAGTKSVQALDSIVPFLCAMHQMSANVGMYSLKAMTDAQFDPVVIDDIIIGGKSVVDLSHNRLTHVAVNALTKQLVLYNQQVKQMQQGKFSLSKCTSRTMTTGTSQVWTDQMGNIGSPLNLLDLNLSYNSALGGSGVTGAGMQGRGMRAVGSLFLQVAHSLTSLDLSYTNMDDVALAALVKAFMALPYRDQDDESDGNANKESTSHSAHSHFFYPSQLSALRYLNLSGNPDLRDVGVRKLCHALSSTPELSQLRLVNLSHTGITVDGGK